MTVRDIDRGYARFVRELEKMGGGVSVTVGIHEEEGAEDHPGASSATIVEVGALAEFGTVNQEARSFLRSTFDEEVGATGRDMVAAACKVAKREATIEAAFGDVGLTLLGKMIDKMGETAPLDEGTVEEKGGDEPLLDTGATRQAMTVRVNGDKVAA